MASSAAATQLVGREEELVRVGAWVELLQTGGAALVLVGEPGIGKTSVWSAAVATAREAGALCLVTRPVESELPLAYAGLVDLLGPEAEPLLGELPERLATSVAAALLLGAALSPADPHAVARGTLSLLQALAGRRPVVLAIDDVQWLDPATTRALAFALRRLESARVGVVASLRDAHDEPLGLAEAFGDRAHRLAIGGLSVGALGHLLRAQGHADMSRRTITRVHERSGGNPFFALELARENPAGEELPRSLLDVIGRRVGQAPAEAEGAVELAAVLGSAPTAWFDDVAALDAAIGAAILVERGGEIRFAHPLLAAAAYDRLPPGRRRDLHRLAAERAGETGDRARHLALATDEPDAGISAFLEAAALELRGRGAPEAGAELAAHARRLTPQDDGDAFARRAMDEADCLLLADDDQAALALADQVLASGVRGVSRVRALGLRALHAVEATTAVALLEEAVAEPHDDTRLAAVALAQLAWQRGCWLGDVQPAVEEAAAAVELARKVGDDEARSDALTTAGLLASLVDDERAESWFREALTIDDSFRSGAGRVPRVAYAHELSRRGAFGRAQALLDEEREQAIRFGDEWLVVRLDIFASEFALRRGDWDEAERMLTAVLPEVRDYWRAVALTRRAMLSGRRGDPAALDDARAVRETPFNADPVLAATVEHAVGLVELAAGRPEAATKLLPLVEQLDGAGARAAEIEDAIPETVLGLVEAGRTDDAERLTRTLETLAARSGDAWRVPAAALCRGLLLLAAGGSEASLGPLGLARSGFEAIGVRWELAHTLLAQGGALRRLGRRTDAAAAIEEAARIFGELRAEPWRARAADELRRARPRPRRDDTLTAAESRVARLVAAGRTNKEAAAELFTSVATVEAHLTRIYRKLELRSRTELTRAVADGRVELDGTPPG